MRISSRSCNNFSIDMFTGDTLNASQTQVRYKILQQQTRATAIHDAASTFFMKNFQQVAANQ